LGVQLSSAAWLVYLAWPDMLGSLIPANPVTDVVGVLLCTVLIIWIINLYNFMDGIDALAGLEFCSLMLGVVCSLTWLERLHDSSMDTLYLATLGLVSVLGFLPLNWPPARIFMGDTGSNFLGYLLAAIAIITINQHQLGVAFWLIAPAIFWVDASVTLARRLLTGQTIYRPHRTHAYQHAALRLNSHKKVSVAIAAINLLYLIPLALFSELYKTFVGIFIAAAYLPVFSLAIYFKAGTLMEQER
jgi:Fuc2NAc and GlcNAc transferase